MLLFKLVLIGDVALFLVTIFYGADRHKFMWEGGVYDKASALHLATVALIAYAVGIKVRSGGASLMSKQSLIWLLIAAGFIYLCFDEMFRVHERIDEWIHHSMGLAETAWSDRIDDLIIFIYLLLGVLFIFYSRRELLAFRAAVPFLFLSIAASGLYVILDVVTNDGAFMAWLISNEAIRKPMHHWLGNLEDMIKLITEAFLIGTALICYRSVSRPDDANG